MKHCFFVSDLHGDVDRYRKLLSHILDEKPHAVFMGGDLLSSGALDLTSIVEEFGPAFSDDELVGYFQVLKKKLKNEYPRFFTIFGNDDPRLWETILTDAASQGLCEYIHQKKTLCGKYIVYGYSHVPPTPFQLKDWERYDVSRYVDPGCVSPEEGMRTREIEKSQARYATIKSDLDALVGGEDLKNAVFLFHSPPYKTNLDLADLKGKMIDHVPLDVHVGSIAIERFIRDRQPLVSLHGHVHESPRLSGSWRDKIGRTFLFSAAHDGPELALVRFNLTRPDQATRELI